MQITFKSLLPILSITALLGGFYYTTQLRLGNLEEKVGSQQEEIRRLNSKVDSANSSLRKLNRQLKKRAD